MKNLISIITDLKKEINEIIKSKLENYLEDMNIINFEDYQILSDKIEELSKNNQKLQEHISSLEKKLNEKQ